MNSVMRLMTPVDLRVTKGGMGTATVVFSADCFARLSVSDCTGKGIADSGSETSANTVEIFGEGGGVSKL